METQVSIEVNRNGNSQVKPSLQITQVGDTMQIEEFDDNYLQQNPMKSFERSKNSKFRKTMNSS